MKTYHFVIDVGLCQDCNCCLLACKDEHVGNSWPGYSLPQPVHGPRWMDVKRHERGTYPLIDVAYLPTTCMHCQDAPCQKASNAVYRRADGIVMIDPNKALGQKDLVGACPYHAIWWNEAQNAPQKCTLCAHLLDTGWEKPRCVQACSTGALELHLVEPAEMDRMAKAEGLETLHPELKTGPQVYYRNLYRYASCFVAGSVACRRNGIEECVRGASVSIYLASAKVEQTETDAYGDFKLDRLVAGKGPYRVEVAYQDFAQSIEVALAASANLGVIYIA